MREDKMLVCASNVSPMRLCLAIGSSKHVCKSSQDTP